MTTTTDVLVVEVSEGTDELAARLAALRLPVRRDGRELHVLLEDDETYDRILRRSPISTCRCTASTSAATGWRSSSADREAAHV